MVVPMNVSTPSVAASPIQTPQDLLHTCGGIIADGMLEQFGWIFYYIKPNSSIFTSVDGVPNYEVQIFPIFGFLMVIEQIIRFAQHKRFSRISDIVINIGAGLVFIACR